MYVMEKKAILRYSPPENLYFTFYFNFLKKNFGVSCKNVNFVC